jgi:ADP-heptose:LPS heptosyltransferase
MSVAVTADSRTGKPGDILVIYRKQLGDLLLLQPAIEHLSKRFGRPVQVRTRAGFADLLALMPGQVTLASRVVRPISRVYCFDTKRSSLADALASWPARRILVLTRPASAWWQPVFFHDVLVAQDSDEYRARLFQRAVGGDDFRPPRLNPPPAEWLPADLPPAYVVVHPTTAWRRKTWPAENWVALLRAIQARHSCPLLITAGSEGWEREMADAIASGLPTGTLNLAGKTSLKNYLALLAGARAVLTVDGSASHLAAAFGRPVLTLFGPTNPAHWHYPGPLSKSLWAGDFLRERKPPVAAIPVAAATAAASELLAGWRDV